MTIITAILGIIATILAWKFNPQREMYAELDYIDKQLDAEYRIRDKALIENNNDQLTLSVTIIAKLKIRKNIIMERLKK